MIDCAALVVAAGRGQRFGGDVPKQYLALAGAPVLRRSVLAFVEHPRVDAVRVVIHPDDREAYDGATEGLDLMAPTPGGASRQDSVRLGLESLEADAPRHVLIHDAARPLVGAAVISNVLDGLADAAGAVPAVPVVDTLKRAAADATDRVAATVERAGLWRAQTPQGFRFAEILAAHRALAGSQLTDDAAVAETAGLDVALVEGAEANVKVTTSEDFRRAERDLGAAAVTRTGLGFDVHRLEPGSEIVLGGVAIPHERRLAGHSDADVVLHALTDAILGAIAAGDIGEHFPPSEPQWRGAASETFLAHARDLVAAAGGRIVNVDVTVVCERPKIGPHRARMVERIAAILGLAPEAVSVKATTTERLGFTGRGEGIAAQAIATVSGPF